MSDERAGEEGMIPYWKYQAFVLTNEEVIELQLLRDALQSPLFRDECDPDFWLKMETSDKHRWLELVEKILAQRK